MERFLKGQIQVGKEWLESFAGRGTKEMGTGLIQRPHASFVDSPGPDGRGCLAHLPHTGWR